jgi:hypothetical protein
MHQNMEVFKYLPLDTVKYCLSYDNRFQIRKGEIVQRIAKDDPRYNVLKDKPIIWCRTEKLGHNVYASYLDGKNVTESGIKYSIVQFFYISRNMKSYYIRKIDVMSGMEISLTRHDLHG